MKPPLSLVRLLPWLCVLLLSGLPCLAAEPSKEIVEIQQRIAQMDKLEATSANKQLKEVYQQILVLLQEEEGYLEKGKILAQQLKEHDARARELKRSLELLGVPQPEPEFADKPIQELERMQEGGVAEKISLQRQLDEAQSLLAQLQSRLVPAQNELSEAKKHLAQEDKDGRAAVAALDGNLASALLLKKRKANDVRMAQIQCLDLELLNIPSQIEQATLKRGVLAQKLKNLDQNQEKLQNRLQQLRRAESASILDESLQLRKATTEDPALAWLAEDNVALGNQLALFAETSQSIADRRSSIENMTKLMEQRYILLKQQLELGGDGGGIGELMRQTLVQLKLLGNENTPKTIADIQKAQIQSLLYERQINEASDRAGFVQAVVARFPDSQLTVASSAMRESLTSLVDLRLNLLAKLLERNQQSLKNWSLLLNAQNQFNDQLRQFDKLLKENLLWTATNPAMGLAWLRHFVAGREASWPDPRELWGALSGQSAALLAWLSLYGLLVYAFRFHLGPRLRAWQLAANDRVGSAKHDRFRNTLLMLGGELLATSPAPVFLAGLGRTLGEAGYDEVWLRLSAEGMRVAALACLCLGMLRRLAKPDGFLAGQLGWPLSAIQPLHRELRLQWLLVLLVACFAAAETQGNDMIRESGRLPFLAFCLLVAAIILRLDRGWRLAFGGKSGPSWAANELVQWLGRLFALGEACLAAMEVAGYHLGALVLQANLLKTLGWALLAVLVHQMLQRWLLLEQRKVAYARAQAIRAELRAGGEEESDESSQQDKRRQFAEIQTISLQLRTLLRLLAGTAFLLAVGWVWSDLVPALHLLDQVVLWESASSGAGEAGVVAVTLKSLGLSLAILGLIVLASRNLPGMVQLLVLPHLKLAQGTDFAVTALLRHLIFVSGLVAICKLLGLRWDDLQWLVAALGVGLGFGLQEIFANFISGLILLFERPVRIGDIVTLSNGVTGKIDAINTRATTLTDWDNKEVIIPNKAMITEQLTNWSLSSHIIRVVVPVGIAYGSDTELAHRLLLQAAGEHPLVLDKPEKVVLFRAFGSSSMDFELRCFVSSPDLRVGVIHDLNMHIDKLFRQHGVEIAFPQVDVHLKGGPAGLRVSPD